MAKDPQTRPLGTGIVIGLGGGISALLVGIMFVLNERIGATASLTTAAVILAAASTLLWLRAAWLSRGRIRLYHLPPAGAATTALSILAFLMLNV